jgi:putative peptidoglycan lipid II flippase
MGQIRATLAHAISLMMLLNVPSTVGLIVLADPIVRVIFEHGSFSATDTAATASALRFYALGLLGYSVVRIVSPAFYALGRSRTPVMISAASVVANVALNLALVGLMGYRGLALGTSLTALLNAALQILLIRREIGGVDGRTIAASFGRVSLAAAVMGVAAAAAEWLLRQWLPGESLGLQALRLGWSIALAMVVLFAAAWALRIPELAELRALVVRRVGRRSGE